MSAAATSGRAFRKGDQVIGVGIWNDPWCQEPKLYVTPVLTLSSMGPLQGTATYLDGGDVLAARIYSRSLDVSVFRADEEPRAIAAARSKLERSIENGLAICKANVDAYGTKYWTDRANRFADLKARLVWESAEIHRPARLHYPSL